MGGVALSAGGWESTPTSRLHPGSQRGETPWGPRQPICHMGPGSTPTSSMPTFSAQIHGSELHPNEQKHVEEDLKCGASHEGNKPYQRLSVHVSGKQDGVGRSPPGALCMEPGHGVLPAPNADQPSGALSPGGHASVTQPWFLSTASPEPPESPRSCPCSSKGRRSGRSLTVGGSQRGQTDKAARCWAM